MRDRCFKIQNVFKFFTFTTLGYYFRTPLHSLLIQDFKYPYKALVFKEELTAGNYI